MPSADGFVRSTSGGRFRSTFMIEDIKYHFSASLGSSIPAFTCNTATLTYGALKQLTATRNYKGTVGPNKIKLEMEDDGPKITGTLDMPISPGSNVSGSGVWAQDFH